MSSVSSESSNSTLPIEILQEIEALCDAFEAEWKSGSRPTIEAYLQKIDSEKRRYLLVQLLEVEVAMRIRGGETPNRDEYHGRFPDATPLIDEAIERASLMCLLRSNTFEENEFEGFEIYEQIGAGGMGVVHRALQKGANRIVALKLIRPELLEEKGPSTRRHLEIRFLSEGRLIAGFNHPNIVPVHEVGRMDDRIYIAMHFVEGYTLSHRLDEGAIDGDEAARIVLQISKAVHYAHQKGVLHRDLKPGNVIVTHAGHPFVTDFGLAKRFAHDYATTPVGSLVGTPYYLAPEIVADSSRSKYSVASDVYALGATLYQLLANRVPFDAKQPVALFKKIVEEDPILPSRYVSAVHPDLDAICAKCLQKNPKERYRTANELAEDLERFLNKKAVLAPPPKVKSRWRRWINSPWAIATACALIFSTALFATLPNSEWYRNWQFRSQGSAQIAKVAEGETVQLIDNKIPQYRWRAGNGDVQWVDLGNDRRELVLTTLEPSILLFNPAVRSTDYQIVASIRMEETYNPFSYVGIVVGHREFTTSEGLQHAMVRVGFSDLGMQAFSIVNANKVRGSAMDMKVFFQGRTKDDPYRQLWYQRPDLDLFYVPQNPAPTPRPSRKITIDVRDKAVDAVCHWVDDKRVSIKAKERWIDFIPELTQKKHADIQEFTDLCHFRGGFGIYLYGCKAAIESFELKPYVNPTEQAD
jgi:serine/threonine protein kinase